MIFTEEQAKTKWCPYTRYSANSDDHNAANRWEGWIGTKDTQEAADACCCVTSSCMAWRWVIDKNGALLEAPDGALQGYCGMGGSLMGPQS